MDVCPDANMPWEGGALVDKRCCCRCGVVLLCSDEPVLPGIAWSFLRRFVDSALRKMEMLLKDHIIAAIKDRYEEAAQWLLYTYFSYILSQVSYLPGTWAPAHRRLLLLLVDWRTRICYFR